MLEPMHHARPLHQLGAAGGSSAVQAVSRELSEKMNVHSLTAWLETHSHQELPPQEYLRTNSEFALRAHSEIGPARQVSEELFVREVLPYRQLDEPIDNWRPQFYEKLLPVARDKVSLRDLADAVVVFAFEGLGQKLEFKGNSTPQVMAPVSETLAKGYASCTGLSILVANALRAVGVPARVVGTPEWHLPAGGNHNWVEAWLGDGWHFMDAVPTKKVEWDSTWFTKNTQVAIPGTIHGIYTPVWDKHDADGQYLFTWRDPPVPVPALDRTNAYKHLRPSKWDPGWAVYRDASEGLR